MVFYNLKLHLKNLMNCNDNETTNNNNQRKTG